MANSTEIPRVDSSASVSPGPRFELVLEQENPRVVDALVKFLYSGKIPFDLDKMAKELLIVADFFDVQALKNLCSEWMTKELCLKNAIESLITAHRHGCSALKAASLELVVKNAAKFMAQENWDSFVADHPELLNLVLFDLANKRK